MDYIGLEDIKGTSIKQLTYFKPDKMKNFEKSLSMSSLGFENSKNIGIQRSVLAAHPHITIHNKLLDSHLYIFSHWVLDVIERLPEPRSIKGSLIPRLVEIQNAGTLGMHAHFLSSAFLIFTKFSADTLPEEAQKDNFELANTMSIQLLDPKNKLNCYALLVDDSVYLARANTTKLFSVINSDLANGQSCYLPLGVPVLDKKGAVDFFTSDSVKIHDKASVRFFFSKHFCHFPLCNPIRLVLRVSLEQIVKLMKDQLLNDPLLVQIVKLAKKLGLLIL